MIRRLARAVDDRLGGARWARSALNHVFPDHWSFMLGEVALYSFVVLVLTGVFLTLFFEPSSREVVYRGQYEPLSGLTMSAAYESVIRLSFDVRAGLVFRQIHHWASNLFLAALVAHVARIFFTGAFRRPREVNWMVGVTLLLLALVNGFLGYSLLDDLLSGTGLRIAYSITESLPVVGAWAASLAFAGEWPGEQTISRLFIAHVLIVPVLIAGLIGVHLSLIWRQKHTQFPGAGKTERNVVGSRLFPTYATKSVALFLGVFGVLAALGGLAQINPVWLYGPYDPAAVTTAAQPDWYVGWLEGALRLFPPWEIRAGNYMVANPFFPGVLVPALFFLGMYAYPFVERWLSADRRRHELLDQPRFHPVRTGFGVGVLSWFVVLFIAGGQDVIGSKWNVSVQALAWSLRVAAVTLPPVTGLVAWAWCRSLAAGTLVPVTEAAGSPAATARIVDAAATGEHAEEHEEVATGGGRAEPRTDPRASAAAGGRPAGDLAQRLRRWVGAVCVLAAVAYLMGRRAAGHGTW